MNKSPVSGSTSSWLVSESAAHSTEDQRMEAAVASSDERERVIPCMWVQADLIGEHVHVKMFNGRQYKQPDFPSSRLHVGAGFRDDAGEAGTIILQESAWLPFIKALACGGYRTGLRVIWNDAAPPKAGCRRLWNGHPDLPCFHYGHEATTWEPDRDA